MAKRKRLTSARLTPSVITEAVVPSAAQKVFSDTETDTVPAQTALSRRAPIAGMAGDAALQAGFEDMRQALTDAQVEGRMILRLSLDDIDDRYLVRDRIAADEEEMRTLRASIAARGQQVAIEVADLGTDTDQAGPRWGLISGWRRLMALRQIASETGAKTGAAAGTVLAIVRAPKEASDAYIAMVEENEIRVGLSHYERARIVARAVDRGVYEDDRDGLRALFGAVSRPKRSKIGSFIRLVRALDGDLRYPAAIPERTGLALVKAIDTAPGFAPALAAALQEADPASEAAEAAVIAAVLNPAAPSPIDKPPAAKVVVQDGDDGVLILSGRGVADPGFRDRLERWLARR